MKKSIGTPFPILVLLLACAGVGQGSTIQGSTINVTLTATGIGTFTEVEVFVWSPGTLVGAGMTNFLDASSWNASEQNIEWVVATGNQLSTLSFMLGINDPGGVALNVDVFALDNSGATFRNGVRFTTNGSNFNGPPNPVALNSDNLVTDTRTFGAIPEPSEFFPILLLGTVGVVHLQHRRRQKT